MGGGGGVGGRDDGCSWSNSSLESSRVELPVSVLKHARFGVHSDSLCWRDLCFVSIATITSTRVIRRHSLCLRVCVTVGKTASVFLPMARETLIFMSDLCQNSHRYQWFIFNTYFH